jgi:hypothetical protein
VWGAAIGVVALPWHGDEVGRVLGGLEEAFKGVCVQHIVVCGYLWLV